MWLVGAGRKKEICVMFFDAVGKDAARAAFNAWNAEQGFPKAQGLRITEAETKRELAPLRELYAGE